MPSAQPRARPGPSPCGGPSPSGPRPATAAPRQRHGTRQRAPSNSDTMHAARSLFRAKTKLSRKELAGERIRGTRTVPHYVAAKLICFPSYMFFWTPPLTLYEPRECRVCMCVSACPCSQSPTPHSLLYGPRSPTHTHTPFSRLRQTHDVDIRAHTHTQTGSHTPTRPKQTFTSTPACHTASSCWVPTHRRKTRGHERTHTHVRANTHTHTHHFCVYELYNLK